MKTFEFQANGAMGMTIAGGGYGQALFISAVVKGSEAELLGVCVHDQPTYVGGVDVQRMNVVEIVAVINEQKRKKKVLEKIILKMSRWTISKKKKKKFI